MAKRFDSLEYLDSITSKDGEFIKFPDLAFEMHQICVEYLKAEKSPQELAEYLRTQKIDLITSAKFHYVDNEDETIFIQLAEAMKMVEMFIDDTMKRIRSTKKRGLTLVV